MAKRPSVRTMPPMNEGPSNRWQGTGAGATVVDGISVEVEDDDAGVVEVDEELLDEVLVVVVVVVDGVVVLDVDDVVAGVVVSLDGGATVGVVVGNVVGVEGVTVVVLSEDEFGVVSVAGGITVVSFASALVGVTAAAVVVETSTSVVLSSLALPSRAAQFAEMKSPANKHSKKLLDDFIFSRFSFFFLSQLFAIDKKYKIILFLFLKIANKIVL